MAKAAKKPKKQVKAAKTVVKKPAKPAKKSTAKPAASVKTAKKLVAKPSKPAAAAKARKKPAKPAKAAKPAIKAPAKKKAAVKVPAKKKTIAKAPVKKKLASAAAKAAVKKPAKAPKTKKPVKVPAKAPAKKPRAAVAKTAKAPAKKAVEKKPSRTLKALEKKHARVGKAAKEAKEAKAVKDKASGKAPSKKVKKAPAAEPVKAPAKVSAKKPGKAAAKKPAKKGPSKNFEAPPSRPRPASHTPSVEVARYLTELERLGMKFGLTRIEKLLKALGNPEKRLKTIHVVGTNGKSSTARMLSSILTAHGLKTGTYVSPHLVSFTERILVNGKEISEPKFEKLIMEVKAKAEDVNKRSRSSGPLTQFEILTAAALLYFKQQKVGVAVIEAGLGGRYDATNVTDSKVQVITNIELEHTDLLGKTVSAILKEKAAVIPEKGNVVLGALSDEAMGEAIRICERLKTKTAVFGEEYSLLKGRGDKFDVWTARTQYSDMSLTLLGQYQRTNCAVAIQAAEVFLHKALDEKKLRRALPRISIPARLEIIAEKPLVVLDGAHNPSGIEELIHSLDPLTSGKRIIGVVSILKDKNYEKMLGQLLEFCDILFITENSNERCMSAQEMSRLPVVLESHVQTFVAPDSQSALESAFKLTSTRDVILVTGSLYLLADIKRRMT